MRPCSMCSARCSTCTRSRAAPSRLFPGLRRAPGLLWREKQLEYSRLRALGGPLREFLAGHARRARVLARDPEAARGRAQCRRCWTNTGGSHRLSMSRPHLQRIAHRPEFGWACCPTATPRCSRLRSSPPACIATFDLVLSADQVRTFKTSPSIYALGPRALKMAAARIFCSSPPIAGTPAERPGMGYTSFWVNRLGAAARTPRSRAARNSASSLADAAAVLSAQSNHDERGDALI